MQNSNNASNSFQNDAYSSDKKAIDELEKIHNETYNELMNPSLGVQLFVSIVFFILVGAIPLQVVFDTLIQDVNSFLQFLYYFVPLLFVIVIGYANIRYVVTFNDRVQLYKRIRTELEKNGVVPEQKIEITRTQHYRLLNLLQITFILGTFFAACLWFLLPLRSRLEPLTIIYGFGTALFEYFKNKLEVPNPLAHLLSNI